MKMELQQVLDPLMESPINNFSDLLKHFEVYKTEDIKTYQVIYSQQMRIQELQNQLVNANQQSQFKNHSYYISIIQEFFQRDAHKIRKVIKEEESRQTGQLLHECFCNYCGDNLTKVTKELEQLKAVRKEEQEQSKLSATQPTSINGYAKNTSGN